MFASNVKQFRSTWDQHGVKSSLLQNQLHSHILEIKLYELTYR